MLDIHHADGKLVQIHKLGMVGLISGMLAKSLAPALFVLPDSHVARGWSRTMLSTSMHFCVWAQNIALVEEPQRGVS